MSRKEVLSRLGFRAPATRIKRVIVHSDIRCEADDPFAILQHLLTPTEEIVGVIAGHNEWMNTVYFPQIAKQQGVSTEEVLAAARKMAEEQGVVFTEPGGTMEVSYQTGKKILELAEMEEVPLLRGSRYPITDAENLPESEGADFIIREALKDDPRPLYVALQGCLTDLAIAYLKEPKIADKVIAIWIGGGVYPKGGDEFNLKQDITAARILFDSPVELWQIPMNVYRTMEFSFAELVDKIRPCGRIGRWLCDQMLDFNEKTCVREGEWPQGETWSIGDNPTVTALLQKADGQDHHMEHAPWINDDYTYRMREDSRMIRVYDSVDVRLTLSDLFSKLRLCYKG